MRVQLGLVLGVVDDSDPAEVLYLVQDLFGDVVLSDELGLSLVGRLVDLVDLDVLPFDIGLREEVFDEVLLVADADVDALVLEDPPNLLDVRLDVLGGSEPGLMIELW